MFEVLVLLVAVVIGLLGLWKTLQGLSGRRSNDSELAAHGRRALLIGIALLAVGALIFYGGLEVLSLPR